MSAAKCKMATEEAFEFESGAVVVVGHMEGMDGPVVDVRAVLELDGRETHDVTIVSTRMLGPRSKPSSMAITLDGVPTEVVRRIHSASHATLTFEVPGALMRIYELSGKATARVWEHLWPLNAGQPYRGLAVEVAIPRGAMCEYGLLGGTSLEGQPRVCRISIPAHGERWSGSLVGTLDEVYAGLPAEFHGAVILAAEETMSHARLSNGVDFDCACHGIVGSNPELFRRLAAAVVCIHADPSVLRDETRLLPMLERLRVV